MGGKMTVKERINDAMFDVMYELAMDVFDRSDSIYAEAEAEVVQSGGHADDDVDQIEMNISDIITEMINERLK